MARAFQADLGPLDFADDPQVSPRAVMRVLERFLPFAVSLLEERKHLLDLGGYEPGLRESNLAAILAHVATSEDYGEAVRPRASLRSLAGGALGRVAEASWDKVPPLAWSYVSLALAELGQDVPPRVGESLRLGVSRWADRLLEYDFPTGLYRDTKAEETCWTAGPLVGAQVLWKGDPRCPAWQEKAHRFYLNAYNREEDLWEETELEGRPVRERVCTANVFPDFTTENHGAFHPTYQTCINNYAIPYILCKKHLGRVPATLTWNWAGLHSVMARLFTGDGRIAYPAGNDYYPYSHAEQSHYLAAITDALRDPLGLWALKHALRNVAAFQERHGGRLVDDYLGGDEHAYWELHFASFAVFAHALAPYRGVPVWDDADALAHARGAWVSPYARILVHQGRRLHTSASLRGLTGKQSSTAFVVPQDARIWTDYFCAVPQLGPTVETAAGEAVPLELVDHRMGSSADTAWTVAAFADEEMHLRRTTALVAHEEGVLHVERLMRYGEQVPIFGSDMDLSRVRAEGPEFRPWKVATLNYRIVNEELARRPIRVAWEGGESSAYLDAAEWRAGGDWILLDGKLGLVRLWGGGEWRLEYRRETTPLHEGHYWKHDTWALNVSFPRDMPPPRGYGFMGGHAVLFVPTCNPDRLRAVAREREALVTESHGDFVFTSRLPGWHATHLLRLGHQLGFT
jgi:hypothetical protein